VTIYSNPEAGEKIAQCDKENANWVYLQLVFKKFINYIDSSCIYDCPNPKGEVWGQQLGRIRSGIRVISNKPRTDA
jgi:hypothetical protein